MKTCPEDFLCTDHTKVYDHERQLKAHNRST
jgi:hypothetical protein